MSGVKNLAMAEGKGKVVITNDKLREEGVCGADERETKKNPA